MARLCDENGQEAEVGKTSGYWLGDEDFVSTDELKAKELGRIGFPRDWPNVYTTSKSLKSLIGKKGKIPGKKVGVVGLPEPDETAKIGTLTLYPLQTFSNAERVEKATGMAIVQGWAIFEILEKDISAAFVAERYWWNAMPDGKWVDFSPRPDDWPELLLSEAATEAPKSKATLKEVDVQIVAHLLQVRFKQQLELSKPKKQPDAAKTETTKTPTPKVSDKVKETLAETKSQPPPKKKEESTEAKIPASVQELVNKVKGGDAEAVKELEDKVKGNDAICAQLEGIATPLVKFLGDKAHSANSLKLLLVYTDAAVSQKNIGVQDDVITAGAVPLLIQLISNGDEQSKEYACATIGNLCHESPDNQDRLAKAGVIKPLAKILTDTVGPDNVGITQEAAYAIWNLTVGHETNSLEFYQAGAVPKLIDMLKSTSDIAQENAAGALMHLSVAEGARTQVAGSDAIQRLIELLAPSYEPEVNCQAAGALLNLATDGAPYAKKMVTQGAVSALINILTKGTDLAKEYAAGALMNLIRGDMEVAEKAAKEGAIPPLAAMLAKPSGHSEALGALANLASGSPERQIAIYKAQITRKSVALLSDPVVDVRRSAAALIMNLAPHAKIKERIVEAGALKPLATILRDKDDAVKERAAGALANLFNDHAANVHAGFKDAPDMIPQLVEAMKQDGLSMDAKRQAAHALAMLAAEDGPCDAVWKAGAGKPLLALLKNEVAEAALAVMNLSWRWQDVKTELAKGDVMELLMKMLKSDDPMTREYACGALMNMTAGSKENAEVASPCVPTLVNYLKAENIQSCEWAAGALANITRAGKDAQRAAAQAGAAELLAALLHKVTANGKNLIVLALTALAESEKQSVRQALSANKEKAKLKEWRDKGSNDELTQYVNSLVQELGDGFAL